MAKKKSGLHWYQVHKAKAGNASVDRSPAVREAKALVEKLEAEVYRCKIEVSNTIGAGLRRLVFGLNAQESLLQQSSRKLDEAKAAARQAEADVRRQGERAYGEDWASRNPDKIRNP
jgi:hypothetical protein